MLTEKQKQLYSCAYFFAAPGLSFSLLTSRLPALVAQIQADPTIIGMILFTLGSSSLAAMFLTPYFTKLFTSRKVLTVAAALSALMVILCGLCPNITFFFIAIGCLGFCLGLTDVTMNIQGILFEKVLKQSKLAFFHAMFAFAAVFASFGSSLLTSLGTTPFLNFLIIGLIYQFFIPICSKRLLDDQQSEEGKKQSEAKKFSIPLFVYLCGFFCLLASETEGVVVDWGSLYVASMADSTQAIAALTFGFFSLTTGICRLFCDRLRDAHGDSFIATSGACISTVGGLLIILSSSTVFVLLGFSLLGLGLAPLVPILFSAGGKYPGISTAKASSVIALFNYGGMLFVPPMFGFLVAHTSLSAPFIVSTFSCIVLAIGTGLLLKRR